MKFSVLADAFAKLEKTSSRIEMTNILADLFKKSDAAGIDKIIYLLQGRIAPAFTGIEIGIGEKFVEGAISMATGYSPVEVEKKYKALGDLGLVAEELVGKKAQKALLSKELAVSDVFNCFMRIAKAAGIGSQEVKIKLLTELLANSSPLEARFVVRIPLAKLRLGIGDPTILDALSVKQVGDKSVRDELERAYNLCSDLGAVARVLFVEGMAGIKKFKIKPGNPIRPMAGERLPSAEEIIKKIGKCAVEGKYDGLRMAVHKDGDRIWIFSRNLENMTHMFPEIVSATKKLKPAELIFEGEALAYNDETGEFRPFQETVQRKRKYRIEEMAEQYPLKLFVFDILYAEGKDFTKEPYKKRRSALLEYVKSGDVIRHSEQMVTNNPAELQKYFEDAVSRGLEGIFAKDLHAEYIAGARKFGWIKLKRSYRGELADTIDVVIVGYFKGRGARAQFGFGGFLGCVYDEKKDMFKTIAKVGSGFTEKQMVDLKRELDKIRVAKKPARVDSDIEPDAWAEPHFVVTVNADEITESPVHTAGRRAGKGYALRFPRMVSWFVDKTPEQATTVSEIEKMYKMQKKVKKE